jgi:hypothetical protein
LSDAALGVAVVLRFTAVPVPGFDAVLLAEDVGFCWLVPVVDVGLGWAAFVVETFLLCP